ncbi:period circadian protein [Ostrinia nubilalis]|uniref:period circadian protein n=1 Tax=Ostrinia nubilalis TaxID=29057 RepID=UPI0030826386
MDNLDDSENNAKVSDSAYSNSCSNSQSRRSHSSKSTHSGSNSSGSSGYGGQPSTSGSSNQPPEKRTKEKEPKKKKHVQIITEKAEVAAECQPSEPVPALDAPKEEVSDVIQLPSPALSHIEKGPESMDISSPESLLSKEEVASTSNLQLRTPFMNVVVNRTTPTFCSDGFSCVISMHDGVVMYTTSSLTATLGFPKDMWVGRSFIDFVHPRDRSTFESQITNGLAIPKIVNGTQKKVPAPENAISTMVCRIRRYRGLTTGFGVKERMVTYMPVLLKLTFKNVSDEDGGIIYLVIQATPFFSAFKVPNEIACKPVPFVMRHAANGNLEYIDPESVPYLGYLPQDLVGEDAIRLYHPEDLCYLRQVYETIVKEGRLPRSNPYRMLTQNGFYVKLETEWSSFINPWSRKLEYVIGKHHIVEGPSNPDVFQTPELEKAQKMSEDEKIQQQVMREKIIKILNEVLTKPAEAAKQRMNKRCQDIASFMESLMEEQPRNDDELRLEIQDPDNSYYERDSMLGGISPHHEYNDSKSSTETPLSYAQLNYNENLQRYFDSHQPFSYEDYNTAVGENIFGLKEKLIASNCMSPMAQHSRDSADLNSSCESGLTARVSSPAAPLGDYQPVRLTESLLIRHNSEMERELLRAHREIRSCSKGEKEKSSNEKKQKKKEHLARCNASFQPAASGTLALEPIVERKPHGMKRASKQTDTDPVSHKHHCPSPRTPRRRHVTTAATTQPSATITTTVAAASQWHPNAVNNMNYMNTFILGVGIPQQMQLMSPVMSQQVAAMPGMPGVFPMYYAPPQSTPMPSTSDNTKDPNKSNPQYPPPPTMQCMMYGQAMYGSPFMYSPVAPSYPVQQTMMAQQTTMAQQTMQYTNSLNPLGLTRSNYEEACKPSVPLRLTKTGGGWRDKKRESQAASSKTDHGSADSMTSTSANNRSTEAVPDAIQNRNVKTKSSNSKMRTSDEGVDRTDGESSYSSFYSSFFKTESGSAEESGDPKKGRRLRTSTEFWDKSTPDDVSSMETTNAYRESEAKKKVPRRKMEPPWMEQVCVTSELIYKYQILTKTLEEVLSSDKDKMAHLPQPSLVNEQLGQLYLDLQLEGVASRLTLEEGITSSSSSGEETSTNTVRTPKKKREYSKLVMIYEEDAPLPPPSTDDEMPPEST